jgi:hypothetical protein
MLPQFNPEQLIFVLVAALAILAAICWRAFCGI